MTNANKAKGDRAETAVLEYVRTCFPTSWRTRAGWDDDRGDIILDLLGDKALTYAIQVKDVASAEWSKWFAGLDLQIFRGNHRGGVIWWKLRGTSDPGKWRVVMTGAQYMGLMARVKSLEAALESINREGEVIE